MNTTLYFLEIKNRLFLLILSWFSAAVVCYIFKETLLFVGVKQSMDFNFCQKEVFYFIFTDVSEIFYVYIFLIFFISNQVLSVCFFYHVFVFITPGLYCSEFLYVTFICRSSLFLFIFSVFVCNKFIFPSSWNFFLSFQNFESLQLKTLYFESKISEYFLFYVSLYYVCVSYFQVLFVLFIICDFFETTRIITVKNFRKFFYYVFIIFSTLITPPDVFSQLLIGSVFIFSYEILVFFYILSQIKRERLIREPVERH